MRAGELAEPFPTVGLHTRTIDAARLMADRNLPGVIVVDDSGRPAAILDGTQVLRMAIPSYCQEDPALARVVDEAAADLFLRGVESRSVADCLSEGRRDLPVVEPQATVLEVAALMAVTRTPLVAVAEKGQPLIGAITLDALLDRMLAA
ncbi:MAG TPA: CBS domain-containing protein [Micromonospora sp.]